MNFIRPSPKIKANVCQEPNYLLYFKDIQITKTKEKERIDKASESKDGIPVFFSKLASKANETLTVVLVLN